MRPAFPLVLVLFLGLPAARADPDPPPSPWPAYTLHEQAGRGERASLRLTRTAPGRWQVERRASSGLVLQGEARLIRGELVLRLRSRQGLAGALSGAAGGTRSFPARYRLEGDRIAGTAWVPTADGGEREVREEGRAAREGARLEGRLRVDGRALRDPWGREVLLRGVNACRKEPPFLPAHTPEQIAAMVREGLVVVRLGIAWRALEPAPGRLDERYLAGVQAAVRRFTSAGAYVLLDMHQDVWGGPLAAHGAPEWATQPEGGAALVDLPADAPWMARYLDGRCWGSFEALWSDRPAPDGVGLQEHYARAWAALAARLRDEERLVGYDLMNEPFYGGEVVAAREALLDAVSTGTRLELLWRALPALLPGGESLEERARRVAIEMAREPARFDALLRALAPVTARFEARLEAFQARVGRAIRTVDPERPLFLEPFGPCGVGVPSALGTGGLSGVVLAPHLYDAFLDADLGYDDDLTRVRRALERHRERAAALGVPLFVGEWGNVPAGAQGERAAREVGALLDAAGVGAAWWDWDPAHGHARHLLAARPGPLRLAGALERWRWDGARLELAWTAEECQGAPTVVTLPRTCFAGPVEVRAAGALAWELDAARGLLLVWGAPGEGVRVEVR